MTQHLHIKIEDLETRVVDVEFRALEKEESVMVHPLLATVYMHECHDILPGLWIVHNFRRLEVEIRVPEFPCLFVVCNTESIMSQLVYWCGAFLETLRLVDRSVFIRREVVGQFWEGFCNLNRCLAIYEMEWEFIHLVIECNPLSTTRCIGIVDWCSIRELCSQL